MSSENQLQPQQNSLVAFKKEVEDFAVEFEVVPYECDFENNDSRRAKINEEISAIDNKIAKRQAEIDKINEEIERLTNHADKLDYIIAVASGVLCGLIDSFFVGEFNLEIARAKVTKRTDEKIIKTAKKHGYERDDVQGAIDKLEKVFHMKQDGAYQNNNMGIGALTHRLDDFAHHPTLLGLFAAIFVELISIGIFVDKNGKWHFPKLDTSPKEFLKNLAPLIVSALLFGLMNWAILVIESKNENEEDEKLPKPIKNLLKLLATTPVIIQVFKIAYNMRGHILSDMRTPAGVPGMLLSFLKELSAIPPFNLIKVNGMTFPRFVETLYLKRNPDGTKKFDMISELAVFNELGRQAVPVIINEVLVRGFYFTRRLCNEIKEKNVKTLSELEFVDWQKVIPFKNRTIVRMMTIATGTFCAVDMADAAIRSAVKSGGNPAAFGANFLLHVNFVGLGRFAIAIFTDVGMGIKRSRLRDERIKMMNEVCHLENAKVFYRQADMWISAEEAGKAIDEAYKVSEMSANYFVENFYEIENDLDKIGDEINKAEENNPGLKDDILDMLR